MAYIPTIHTFEDDLSEVNENGEIVKVAEPKTATLNLEKEKEQVKENLEKIIPPKKSHAKIILFIFSILFIVVAVLLILNYIKQKKATQELILKQNQETIQKQKAEEELSKVQNDLKNIFPNIYEDVSPYLKSSEKKDGNIIVLGIKENYGEEDIFGKLFSYILANRKKVSEDLILTFNLNENLENPTSDIENTDKTDTEIEIEKPEIITAENLIWENKKIENHEFEIANTGIGNLIYGYVGDKYLIFTTSIKDFINTTDNLLK